MLIGNLKFLHLDPANQIPSKFTRLLGVDQEFPKLVLFKLNPRTRRFKVREIQEDLNRMSQSVFSNAMRTAINFMTDQRSLTKGFV
jgi:hypothetical protein